MRRTIFVVTLAMLAVAASLGYAFFTQARAVIRGNVTLGPIYAVCSESVPCDRPLPGFTVKVFDSTSMFVVASTVTDEHGNYAISILPETYTMYTKCSQIGGTCGAPSTFILEPYQQVTIDISVDTGIR
jgi:hypothetical protein